MSTIAGNTAQGKRSWFVRNRWPIVAIAFASVGAIQLLSTAYLSMSEFSRMAFTKAQAKWLASGTWSVGKVSGNAEAAIPISGPRGKGTLFVVGTKNLGLWKLNTLQLAIDDDSKRIDLLAPTVEKPN